jgi:hypothetical protein
MTVLPVVIAAQIQMMLQRLDQITFKWKQFCCWWLTVSVNGLKAEEPSFKAQKENAQFFRRML